MGVGFCSFVLGKDILIFNQSLEGFHFHGFLTFPFVVFVCLFIYLFVLSCLALPCFVLPSLALPCPGLPCLALFGFALHCLAFISLFCSYLKMYTRNHVLTAYICMLTHTNTYVFKVFLLLFCKYMYL